MPTWIRGRQGIAALAALFSLGILLPRLLSESTAPVAILVVATEAEAQAVSKRLSSGADFASVAKEQSIDPTAPDGGYLGKVDPSAMRLELREALRGLAPGQVSPAVRIPAGYAFLRILPDAEAAAAEYVSQKTAMPFAGPGNMRLATDVSGFTESIAIFRKYPKPAGWEQDLRGVCESRSKSLDEAAGRLRTHLKTLRITGASEKEAMAVIDAHYDLAQLLAYQGKLEAAEAEWETAREIAKGRVPRLVSHLDEVLGIVNLHQAEMENNILRAPRPADIFPMGQAGRLPKPARVEAAAQYFLRYLEQKPGDFEVRWLLNVAYMMLGRYPEAVPAPYRMPPALFESKESVGRFRDVAAAAGLNSFEMAGGMIVEDFDNDGLLDVASSSMEDCAPMHFYHNNGNGTFTDRATAAGLSGQLGGLNMIHGDYNNDGCVDILVLRGGWEFATRKSLLRNNCDGTFADVTQASGLAEPATSTQAAAWADIDLDGNLDLFVGNENAPAQLFLNKGDGTFVDIAAAARVGRTAFTKAVTAGDYDNDGYPDFYFSNSNGENFLYHNNRDRTFTELGKWAGVEKPILSFPAWFFDYDNDGWPDLFVSSYPASIEESVRSATQLPFQAESMRLYRNNGNGTFRDVTAAMGLNRVIKTMGSNFGDVDNDGYLDMFLGVGNPSYATLLPSTLLRNREGKGFTDVTVSAGVGVLHKGHGVAFADVDRDGDEDIFFEVGGATPGDKHAAMLFENPGQTNDWINLKLTGVRSNRSAIGARIAVTVENEGKGTRQIFRTVGSGGSFGGSPLEQHVGLGKAARIEKIEIRWPVANSVQTLTRLERNQHYEVREDASGARKVDRPAYKLGRR